MEDTTAEKIMSLAKQFEDNSAAGYRGNKAAARRARKNTLDMEKLLKKYRKESV